MRVGGQRRAKTRNVPFAHGSRLTVFQSRPRLRLDLVLAHREEVEGLSLRELVGPVAARDEVEIVGLRRMQDRLEGHLSKGRDLLHQEFHQRNGNLALGKELASLPLVDDVLLHAAARNALEGPQPAQL
jgi:hypothetical protein